MIIHPYSPVYSFYDEYYAKDYLRTEPLQVIKIKNGTVLPLLHPPSPPQHAGSDNLQHDAYLGGVLDEDGKYINLSAYRTRPIGAYNYNKQEDITISDKKIIYMDSFWNQWGHLLVDGLSRAWYLVKYDSEDFYLAFNNKYNCIKHIKANCIQLISLLGISRDKILSVTAPTIFKEIIIPEQSICLGKYYTNEYIDTIDRIKNSVLQDRRYSNYKYNRIYFSRKKLKGINHVEIGNKNIEKFFKTNGFKIIYPENCSPEEQIAYIHNCKIFASADGSIAHNLVFAKLGTSVVILNRRNYVNSHQYFVNQMRGLSVIYIDVCIAVFRAWTKENNYIIPRLLFPRLRFFFALLLYFIQYIRENRNIPLSAMKILLGNEKTVEGIEHFYALYRERIKKYLSCHFFP